MKSTKLKSIKTACKVTDNIFSKLVKKFNGFDSSETSNLGLRKAFDPIAASGKNGAFPHHRPKDELLNGFCVVDFGVRVNGYCSDMTRMFYVGKPSVFEKKMYDLVLDVQKECVSKVAIGVSGKWLDAYCRQLLGRYAERMVHSLGHGVGRKIHQFPKISSKFDHYIKQGDFVTVEPGVYFLDKFGIRIEDTLTCEGEVLTRSSKKLVLV